MKIKEWIKDTVIFTILLAIALVCVIVFMSGCTSKLGTMDVRSDGEFTGFMFKNCGCGCSSLFNLQTGEEGITAGGKTPVESDAIDVDVKFNLPLK